MFQYKPSTTFSIDDLQSILGRLRWLQVANMIKRRDVLLWSSCRARLASQQTSDGNHTSYRPRRKWLHTSRYYILLKKTHSWSIPHMIYCVDITAVKLLKWLAHVGICRTCYYNFFFLCDKNIEQFVLARTVCRKYLYGRCAALVMQCTYVNTVGKA